MAKLKRSTQKKEEPSANYVAIGGIIMATIIPHLDLDAEDQEYVNSELKWLFSAADNFFQVYQTVQQRIEEENSRLIRKYALDVIGDRKRDREMKEITPQIWREEIERSRAVEVSIPPDAQVSSQVNNRVLSSLEDYELEGVGSALEGSLLITRHLDNLSRHLERATQIGVQADTDVHLQNEIKLAQLEIIKITQKIAKTLEKAYGIRVTSPDDLAEFLQQ